MNEKWLQQKIKKLGTIITIAAILIFIACSSAESTATETNVASQEISLPQPSTSGSVSVEEALNERRSVRSISSQSLSLNQISQIMWSLQGITGSDGRLRTAPSAGALYGLEVYIAVKNASSISNGIYRYSPQNHSLISVKQGNFNSDITAATSQNWINDAPAIIIISGVFSRLEQRYGDRAQRYTVLEAGHAAQNLCLQLVALGLATTPVGAFNDNQLKNVIGMSNEQTPIYVLPVGYPQL